MEKVNKYDKARAREAIARKMSKAPHTKAEYMAATGLSKTYITPFLKMLGIAWSDKGKITNEYETLCFRCQNKSCTWALHHIPVEGWEAFKTKAPIQGKGHIDSYCVTACPKHTPSTSSEITFRLFCDAVYAKMMAQEETLTTLIIGKVYANIVTSVMDLDEFRAAIGLTVPVAPTLGKWGMI